MTSFATTLLCLLLTLPSSTRAAFLLSPLPQSQHLYATAAKPIDEAGWPNRFPAKEHCSKCGLCETSFVDKVTAACAFLGDGMSRMDSMESAVHDDRSRSLKNLWSPQKREAEEARFGVLHAPVVLAKGVGIDGAQWTGCITGICLAMLESNQVDAVVCIASNEDDWTSPMPIICKTSADILKGRGVKPSLAPSLKVLDQIQADASIRRLLFCGVGCAVQAFRAVEHSLGLERVYVLGTNCVDNSPTPQAAKKFIEKGIEISSDQVQGYEFMQDFQVHVKMANTGEYIKKPYFTLPGTIAEPSIATSCLACFDYTNGLADAVVGYMGAPLSGSNMDASFQTLTMRNTKGAVLVETAKKAGKLQVFDTALGSTSGHEAFAVATVLSDSIVLNMVGDNVPEKGTPQVLGKIMAFGMTAMGPKGIAFARYSIDYHILRNYLHILLEWGEARSQRHMPQYSIDIVEHYKANFESFAKLCDRVLAERRRRRAK